MSRAARPGCANCWERPMTDDKDPVLLRLFAEDPEAAPPPDFDRQVAARIARLRRRRAVLAGVGLALSGAAVLAAARWIDPLTAPTQADAWLNSPIAMAAGASLVLMLVLQSRRRMRRR